MAKSDNAEKLINRVEQNIETVADSDGLVEKKEEKESVLESDLDREGIRVDHKKSQNKGDEGDIGQMSSEQEPKVKKDPQLVKVEEILEDGLVDIYRSMDEEHRKMFAKAGEETSVKINKLLKETKVKVKKILELIKAWLQMIPGINKWYVVQESKIKTDRIIKLKTKNIK